MINPWTQGRVPGVRTVPTLGAWQNRRKLASAAYVPPQWARLSLKDGHLFWYVFPTLTLSSAQTDLTRITVQEDFWLLAVLGDGTATFEEAPPASGSFRALIYEDQNSYKWAKYGVDQNNFVCSALEPGLQRIPHFIANGSPVNCKIQNLTTQTNAVQIALFGYSTWWRK